MTEPARYARLTDRALIRVEGPDWRTFLQGLLTQDVEGLAEDETRYAALLTPQGRVLHDLLVTADGAGAWLDVAETTADALLSRLKLYRLRAKVELARVEEAVVALWGPAEPAPGWRPDPRLPALGWRGAGLPPPSGATQDDPAAYDRHRLELGVGDVVRDGLADKLYALEANFDLLNGVDFHKGCFVGQETTSRMKRRGVARSRLLPIRFEGGAPEAGTEVLSGELRAGVVHSGAEGIALALMRLDRAVGTALTADGRPVRLEPPLWTEAAIREALAAKEAQPSA
jgi:tRNA-modifying protein YgfZ